MESTIQVDVNVVWCMMCLVLEHSKLITQLNTRLNTHLNTHLETHLNTQSI